MFRPIKILIVCLLVVALICSQSFSQTLSREAYRDRLKSFQDSLRIVHPNIAPTKYREIVQNFTNDATPFDTATIIFSDYWSDSTISNDINTNFSTSSTAYDLVPDHIERQALVDLYNGTNGADRTNNTNWLNGTTSEDFEDWFGVSVYNGDVVHGRFKTCRSIPLR